MTRLHTSLRAAAAASIAFAALQAVPQPASACGGFFCQRTPMNQAGENILFASHPDGSMTAYVQILYSGEADRFAWVLPLPSVPTLAVGTDALFNQLGSATAPQFTYDYVTHGTCRPYPSCGWYDDFDRAGGPPFAAGGAGPDAAAAADAGAGVRVVLREAVGPYDAVVLAGGTAQELHTWLVDNDYDIPATSIPILEDYVTAGHVFVAIRLLADRDTTEIQPLVLHYIEGSPCVPLRLTAIATVPDMPIFAYFLAEARAVPTNYSLIEPIFDDPALWLGGRTYEDWLSDAADALGGQAFVTDYSAAPPTVYLELPSVMDLADASTPGEFLDGLFSRGYLGDPQLLALFLRYMPPPDGVEPTSYYNCFARCGAVGSFDGPGLAAAIEENITAPRREAQALVEGFPQLTRLATRMSAAEMNVDPTFRIDSGLEDVSNVHRATLHTDCGPTYFEWAAPQRLVLPSGRAVVAREGIEYVGSDDAYCEDMRSGDFGPWVEPSRARARADLRRLHPGGGGGLCAARPGSGSAAVASVGLLAALSLLLRRRR